MQNFNIELLGTKGDYAGIGSRKVNRQRSKLHVEIGFCMALAGYRDNSGAADSSDTNFEFGAKAAYNFVADHLGIPMDERDPSMVIQIFLPWPGFNGRGNEKGYVSKELPEAELLTAKYHHNWANLSDGAKKMMSRNAMQILGIDLAKKTKFVICETPDGAYTSEMTTSKTGGTGQAIRIAGDYNVQVFNLKNPEHRKRLQDWVDSFSEDFMKQYGFDPRKVVEQKMTEHKGLENVVEGDLIEKAKKGEIDVLVHGCNCQNVKGSGFAKLLFDEFPEAYKADQATKKGDSRKLGTYSSAEVERNGKKFTIVNAYTQVRWGRDPDELYVDYNKMRDVFKKISKDFRGRQIALPQIGAGLANGCWITLSNIVKDATKYMKPPMLVALPGTFDYANSMSNKSLQDFILPMTNDDKFVFFWGKQDPFSQWHPSKFVENGIEFLHCEQYMMYQKAILFNDQEKAEEILKTSSPKICKDKGKEVRGFIQSVWDANFENIIFEGNRLKFSQNTELLKSLVMSGNRILVEASPYDDLYGIGLRESHIDARNPSRWKGKNKLGLALERARSWIMSHSTELSAEARSIVEESLELLPEAPEEEAQLMLI